MNFIKFDRFLSTPIDYLIQPRPFFAGIIGDGPSQYSKSPFLWNAAFKQVGMDAVYVPFDVPVSKLTPFLTALRQCKKYLGGNVTVPYKIEILPLLDEIDPKARQIGAVNTIVRTREGKLVGYNTDGIGALDSLTRPSFPNKEPFFNRLNGSTVVMMGAGGAARALVFSLVNYLGKNGRLIVSNRSSKKGKYLANAIKPLFQNCLFVEEKDLISYLPEADLVINATSKGQSGLRLLRDSKVTCLESYSALGSVYVVALPKSKNQNIKNFIVQWFPLAQKGIIRNLEESFQAILKLKREAKLFDLIYSPTESVFLQHGRLSGHSTLNGQGMIIWQAVHSFCNNVMRNQYHLKSTPTIKEIHSTMVLAWNQVEYHCGKRS